MKSAWMQTTVAVVLLGIVSPTWAQSDRPNILFIFSDDHAPHAIGAYDGWLRSVNPTPNIDRLASQGMLFRNSFCTVSYTHLTLTTKA